MNRISSNSRCKINQNQWMLTKENLGINNRNMKNKLKIEWKNNSNNMFKEILYNLHIIQWNNNNNNRNKMFQSIREMIMLTKSNNSSSKDNLDNNKDNNLQY